MFSLLYSVYDYLFSEKEIYVPIIGLDGAGKTTFMEASKNLNSGTALKIDKVTPTVGLNICKVKIGKSCLVLWDLSGEKSMRKMWPNFISQANAMIYIIDSADHERILETKETFHNQLMQETFKNIPVLLLANKQDVESALPPNEISQLIDITNLGDVMSIKILPTSAIQGKGVLESLEWIESKTRNLQSL